MVDSDELGPASAESFPERALVREAAAGAAVRAKQEMDSGRRGRGSIFGAVKPIDGEACTHPYPRRSAVNFADFLERVAAWLSPECERSSAMMDNVSAHRATDVLLFARAHPRGEVVFPPKYAAYLKLSASWWKILRSLARTCRRCATWDDRCRAIHDATASWTAHRHPLVWGRRRRHQRRRPGIAPLPTVA